MRPEAAVRLDRTIGRPVYRVHRTVYRLTGGRLGGRYDGRPILLLTTTGRKTGQPRTTTLQYLPDGEDMIVVASNGGRPEHPAWLANVRADQRVTAQVGRRRIAAQARILDADERARMWDRLVEFYPGYGHYQTLTDRPIQVVRLTPAAS